MGALVAAVTFSSCATFTDNANAARVGDVELSRADLERYLHDALAARDSTEVPDELSADIHRQVIGGWIVDEMIRQFLVEQGVAITEANREAAAAQIDSQLGGTEVSDFLRQYEIDSMSARMAFEGAGAFDTTLLDFAREQSVYVDPVYGYWDLDVGLVQPMAS